MRARVLFFGLLKDIVGRSADEREFASGADLGVVFETYATQFPRMREMAGSIVVAHNREFAPLESPIADGDEIAFLPPVSGGCAKGPIEVTDTNGNYNVSASVHYLVNGLKNGNDEDGHVEAAYHAFPLRLVIVGSDGQVVLDAGRGSGGIANPWDMNQIEEQLRAALPRGPLH